MATQRTAIYFEGVALDLDKNVDIDFTYAISDIADFEKRTTTYSKTIYIPGTAHNNFLFGSYFDFNINNPYSGIDDNIGVNFNPLKKAFAKVTLDNIEIFAGVLRLLEIKYLNGELIYECALFGSLNDLFSNIGDKLLTDLELAEFNQIFNLTNIEASYTRTDYIYALSNYGKFKDATPSKIDVSNFRPTLFCREIFDKIMTEAGYTYNTAFWEVNNLDKMTLLNNEDNFTVYISNLGSANLESQIIDNLYSSLLLDPGSLVPSYFSFADDGLGNYYIVNNSSSDIKATFKGMIVWSRDTFEPLNFSIGMKDLFTGVENYSEYPISGGVGSFNYEFTFVLRPGAANEFRGKLGGDLSTATLQIGLSSNLVITNYDNSAKVPALYGKAFEGKSFVPTGIKQSDFIKSIVNLLNLYVIQDKDNEFNLEFIPYPDFYTDTVIDWDGKKDLDKGFLIKSSNDFLPKTMSFKYKPDNDYYSKLYNNKYNSAYGNKTYTTGNEFSKDDKALELIFSLVPNVFINADMALPAMFDINPDGSYKIVKTNPKLVFFGGVKTCTNYEIYNGDTLLDGTNIEYPYFGHLYNYLADSTTTELFDLAFEPPKEIYLTIGFYPAYNLFVKYYQEFIGSQDNKDVKLVTLYFLLNTVDLMELDFRKLIKVQNGLYYLNKIDGYNPLSDELTKVELLRIA